jgi:secreted PhoX family phosphatase
MEWRSLFPSPRWKPAAAGAISVGVAAMLTATALAAQDFGLFVQDQLRAHSQQQFGVNKPVESSSPNQVSAAQAAADPSSLFTLAGGLRARIVTSGVAAPNLDMLALWPDDRNPTHLIACNEQGVNDPGLQRIEIATGKAETIVTGTSSCDPARRTPWGTILFAEEAGGGANGGRIYELIDPLNTTGVTLNRATGAFTGGVGAANLTARPALGRLSFEGQAIYANGLVYYGDEQRPANGVPGGAYFKFVPTTPRNPSAGPITSLSQSPLVAGKVYGLRVGKRPGTPDFGQGTPYGFGQWIELASAPDADLRALAVTNKLTGYYRPEDIEIDGASESQGHVRFCANNTGNEGEDQYYGETICITDGTLAEATANTAVPEVQPFVIGSPAFAMPDNIAYQPGSGTWVIHEDADTTYKTPHNDDLWACLPDGADEDLLSDGCIRVATLNDLTAEWTGGIFDATGTRFFVSIQHNVSGKGTVIEITGWGRGGDGQGR